MYLYKGVACVGTRSIRGQFCGGGGVVDKGKAVSSLLRSSCRTYWTCRPIIRSFGSASTSSKTAATSFPSSNHHHHHPHQKGVLFPDAVIHLRGDLPYGSREYLLLPPHVTIADSQVEPKLLIASIRAHRNILFDCRITKSRSAAEKENASDDSGTEIQQLRLVHVCLPLVQAALQDAGSQGEQPQAVSTLHGLSSWVVECLEGRLQSQVLNNLLVARSQSQNTNADSLADTTSDDKPALSVSVSAYAAASATDIALGAVRAIATGIPRPGHSVVGVGTYRDGQVAWQALAKEYVNLSSTTATTISTTEQEQQQQQQQPYCYYGSQEAELYQAAGGQLVGIEHLADQQPAYLKSAGGAMARFFFL